VYPVKSEHPAKSMLHRELVGSATKCLLAISAVSSKPDSASFIVVHSTLKAVIVLLARCDPFLLSGHTDRASDVAW